MLPRCPKMSPTCPNLAPSWAQHRLILGLCWPMLGYLGTSWTIFMMQRFEIAEVAKNIQKHFVFQCFCSLSRCYVGAFWSLVGAPSCFHGASEASGVRSKIHAPKMLPRCLHTHQCFKTLRHKQQSSKCYTTLKIITRFPFFCQARFMLRAYKV